jgi:hypothetical protein
VVLPQLQPKALELQEAMQQDTQQAVVEAVGLVVAQTQTTLVL